jgi:hypothetical protein
MTWGLVGELAAVIPAYMLLTSGHPTLAMTLNIVVGTFVGLYVVLPRQALRLRRLSGANLERPTARWRRSVTLHTRATSPRRAQAP